jgi:ABC-type antimicrobial peptide transport system permease subunit
LTLLVGTGIFVRSFANLINVDPGFIRDNSILQERVLANFSSILGSTGLLLACAGVYGIISYAVTLRTPEIGVRIAFGAGLREVRRMVLREALLLVLAGIGIGILVAMAALKNSWQAQSQACCLE